MTDEELFQVLKEISDDCRGRMRCDNCKFNNSGECVLTGRPEDWNLENIENDGTR